MGIERALEVPFTIIGMGLLACYRLQAVHVHHASLLWGHP